MARSFANDLETVHHPHLCSLIRIKRFTGGAIPLDVSDRVLNVQQRSVVGSHGVETSDRDGVAQHSLAHARTQAAFAHHVDAAPKQVLQVHQQSADVEQAAARRHSDEEIDVARFIGIPPSHGTENADVCRAMFCGNTEDFGSMAIQDSGGGHVSKIRAREGWVYAFPRPSALRVAGNLLKH